MPVKKIIFCLLSVLLIMSAIIIPGCKTNKGNTITDNTAADNKVTENNAPDDGKSFPLSFRGTWIRDNTKYTLIFTQDTLKAGNQSYTWIFQSVSGDVYKIKSSNYNYIGTITVRLINGNLVISGDSAVDNEHNWNGIWKKQ